MLRRNTLNFVVDLVTLLVMFIMVVTGLIIRFVLPPGTGGHHGEAGLRLWGLGRHDWGDVHFWAAVALGALLIVHVALHWSWVCTTAHRLLGGTDGGRLGARKQNAYGVGFLLGLVILFGGFTWYAGTAVTRVGVQEPVQGHQVRVEDDALRHERETRHATNHQQIRGSMSLAEVEAATGLSLEKLKSELGLPEQTSAQERLGRLARQYGFSVDTVRDLAAKHSLK